MTVEYRGRSFEVNQSHPEEVLAVKVPLLLRPILNIDVIHIENRFFSEREVKQSPRVVFYRREGESKIPAEPRAVFGKQSSYLLFGEDINKNIYCRLLGIKFTPHEVSIERSSQTEE